MCICVYVYVCVTSVVIYRSPSPQPHPTPQNGPETDPKQSQTDPNGPETDWNGAEMDWNQAFWGGTGGGFVGMGGGVVREKNITTLLLLRGTSSFTSSRPVPTAGGEGPVANARGAPSCVDPGRNSIYTHPVYEQRRAELATFFVLCLLALGDTVPKGFFLL